MDHVVENIEWRDVYAIGHEGVDEDHKRLFRLFNEFNDAVRLGHGAEVVGKLMAELTAYADYHFKREEALMTAWHCPEYADHKRQHESFFAQVLEIKRRMDAGEDEMPFLLSFVEKWILGHILVTDKRMEESMGRRLA